MSVRGGSLAAALLGLTGAAIGCTAWDEVREAYCSAHPNQGDCFMDGGSQPDGGEPDAGGTYDGGPPVTWVIVRGGIRDDDLESLALELAGTEVAISGHFVGAIDFGDGGVVSAPGPSSRALFVARYRTDDGSLLDGNGFRCGASAPRTELPLVYADGGLVLGGTCSVSPATVLDQVGNVLALDGGPAGPVLEPFLFRSSATGPSLRYLGTPESYEEDKRVIGLARAPQGDILLAVNAPGGSAYLGADAGDGGSNPLLARMGGVDLSPQLVDVFHCDQTQVVRWEGLAADPSGENVFATIQASENPLNCSVTIPGGFSGMSAGMTAPGLHRFLYILNQAGGGLRNVTFMGDSHPDAGVLHLVADGPNSLYFAGVASGYIGSHDFGTTPALVVGNMDVSTWNVTAWQFRADPSSEASINDLAVVPGVSPKIWIVGTVKGQLLETDGGLVLASHDPANSDGFLIRLDPTTLAPSQKIVFGTPESDEEGLRLAVRPPDFYVAGTVTPGAGTPLPYVFGGKEAPLIGGRDLLLFRMPIPP